MNRKRHENESFEEYRASLKEEQKLLDDHLKGRFIHVSQDFMENPNFQVVGHATEHVAYMPMYRRGITYRRDAVKSD